MKPLLVFVLMASMLCWMMFAPTYKHVHLMRWAVLQSEADYLLEIGANASHGYIDEAMIASSRLRLTARGFQAELLEYVISAEDGTPAHLATMPVPRGVGMQLVIQYPVSELLSIDRMIGIDTPAASWIVAEGWRMSEFAGAP